MNLRVRFTNEQLPDLELTELPAAELTVRELKQTIWRSRPALRHPNRRPEDLKLIYQGRLLTNAQALNEAIPPARQGSTSGYIYDDENENAEDSRYSRLLTQPSATIITLHCLEPPPSVPQPTNERQQSQQNVDSAITPLFGFDRLRFTGFSGEDVEEIRRHFHQWRPAESNANRQIDSAAGSLAIEDRGSMSDAGHLRRRQQLDAEEEWLEHAQFGGSDGVGALIASDLESRQAAINNRVPATGDAVDDGEEDEANGRAHYQVLLGILVGFFLTWPTLFLWSTEKYLFNYRTQLGITFGLLFNMTFTLLRQLLG